MNATLFQILAVLHGEPLDASTAMRRLEDLLGSERLPSLPAFYRHLRRAEVEGWVAVQGEIDPEGGLGRPRQLFGLTSEGRKMVRSEADRLNPFIALARGRG
jgi:DNA-binding PadR family transcriptional regulator